MSEGGRRGNSQVLRNNLMITEEVQEISRLRLRL